jgi:hypothetical protein
MFSAAGAGTLFQTCEAACIELFKTTTSQVWKKITPRPLSGFISISLPHPNFGWQFGIINRQVRV